MPVIDPALAARNRQRVEEAARKARNAQRRHVVDLGEQAAAPVEPVRLGRDVLAAEWRDPDDLNPNRRTPRTVRGYRRVDTLLHMRRQDILNVNQTAAGVRFRDDHELSEGARPGSERSEVRGGGVAEPTAGQMDALRRWEDAKGAMGRAASQLVMHVALDNRSLTAWAEPRGLSVSVVTGRLQAGLDRLAEHYGLTLEDLRRVEES